MENSKHSQYKVEANGDALEYQLFGLVRLLILRLLAGDLETDPD